MAAFEVIALDTATPQLRAPGASDTYTFPRAVEMPLGTANGVLYLNGSKVVTSGSALTFDGTNLGLGTASPSGAAGTTFAINGGAGQTRIALKNNGSGDASGDGFQIALLSEGNSVIYQNRESGGYQAWDIGGSEQMRLTSTGLGIGTSSPGYKLDVNGTSRFSGAIGVGTTPGNYGGQIDIYTNSDSANNGIWVRNNSAGSSAKAGIVVNASGNSWRMSMGSIANNGNALTWESDVSSPTTRMTLDTSGNLGLGVTPSAWGGGSNVFDVGTYGSLWYSGGFTGVSSNGYFNSGWKYKATAEASKYEQTAGTHSWYTAPSGTAGNAISFSQVMTLSAAGGLSLGDTNDPGAGVGSFNGVRIGGNGSDINSTFNGASSVLTFRINGTERARVTSGGYLGIGGIPVAPLHILTGTRSLSLAALSGGGGASYLLMGNADSGGTAGPTVIVSANRNIQFGLGDSFSVDSGGTFSELARLSDSGNFQIGGSANRSTTTGTAQLMLFDGTAPVGTLANGVSFYSASGEANVMDAAGNATLLSPHDAETNEWIFRSKHTPTGKVLKIDVERLLKFVNDHFGLDAVHEFVEV